MIVLVIVLAMLLVLVRDVTEWLCKSSYSSRAVLRRSFTAIAKDTCEEIERDRERLVYRYTDTNMRICAGESCVDRITNGQFHELINATTHLTLTTHFA